MLNISPALARLMFGHWRCRVEPVHSSRVECSVVVFDEGDVAKLVEKCAESGTECVKVT
jgi:hypothetical protein